MIERMLFALLIVATGAVLYTTYTLTIVATDLLPKIAVIIEAVAIIEDASVRTADSMNVLELIEAERECAANQGEWHDTYRCALEVAE